MFAAKNDAKMCILVFSTTPDSGAAKFGFLFDLDDGLVIMKKGFGIVEVMVSIVVLGFLFTALNHLQLGNHKTFLRIRGRDGATEVAQEVLDKLKTQGIESIPSAEDVSTTYTLDPITRSWERGLGGQVTIDYTPVITVAPTREFTAENKSGRGVEKHVFAKKVNVQINWTFQGSTQSVDISGVIR